jgi:hypothetical protein
MTKELIIQVIVFYALTMPIDEYCKHVFFGCLSSQNIWSLCDLSQTVISATHDNNFAAAVIFQILHQLSTDDASLFACVVWGIWKQRNNKVWNNTTNAQTSVLVRTQTLLSDWKLLVKPQSELIWSRLLQVVAAGKIAAGRTICNVDASFPTHGDKVGIGMCIRDE